MITVGEYLEQSGRSEEELAAFLEVKPHAVRSRLNVPMPRTWAPRLGVALVDEEELEQPAGREHEQGPTPPPGARIVEPAAGPEVLDFSQLAGMIEGAYKLGAAAVGPSDPILAQTVDAAAPKAGQAWARWVESEPKVAAFLQRMMVGTPLGEVIAVHVGIGFSYFLARHAAERAYAEQRAQERAAEAADGDVAGNGGGWGPEPRPAFQGS